MKLKMGTMQTLSGKSKDLIVKTFLPARTRDVLIGCGLALTGVLYTAYAAFKHGVYTFADAEYETMKDIGILVEDSDDPEESNP